MKSSLLAFTILLTQAIFLWPQGNIMGDCSRSIKPLKVFYRPEMDVVVANSGSPSPSKPGKFVAALRESDIPHIVISDFEAIKHHEVHRVHRADFANDVFLGKKPNGFGTYDPQVLDSARYNIGSLLAAANAALDGSEITCSPTSGFHHAGYDYNGAFCTFNGLMIVANKLLQQGRIKKVAIIDADNHFGDGTASILKVFPMLTAHNRQYEFFHLSLGADFHERRQAAAYLERMRAIEAELAQFRPDLILYQAGADVHINDPLGGVLTTQQIKERDEIMFSIARRLNIPLVWNLAGGYQVDGNGGIQPVLEIHMNTARASINDRP